MAFTASDQGIRYSQANTLNLALAVTVSMTLVEVDLPKGCSPAGTPVLLVWPAGQLRPQVSVKPGIRLPNGTVPRSTSTVQIEGEAWMQFSYSFTWDKDNHTLVQLVETAIRRFAKSE